VTKRHVETLVRMFDQEFADKKPSATTQIRSQQTRCGEVFQKPQLARRL
jgi:hypothetical protein